MIGGPQDLVIETNIGDSKPEPVGVRRVPPPDSRVAAPTYDEYEREHDDHVPTLGPPGPRARR